MEGVRDVTGSGALVPFIAVRRRPVPTRCVLAAATFPTSSSACMIPACRRMGGAGGERVSRGAAWTLRAIFRRQVVRLIRFCSPCVFGNCDVMVSV